MQDGDILTRINELISEEHGLRARLSAGELTSQEENDRITTLERALDQCWDLLRQRRARREFGENPSDAAPRAEDEIETYRQ